MSKITDLKPQVKNPTRISVFLDGIFYCGLELETVMRYRLKIGDKTDADALDEIQFDSERTRALDKALTFISKSKKTEKQVADYLVGKGYTEKTIQLTLEKIKSYSFVDDADYANDYVKFASKSKGKRLIAYELARKGISEEDVDRALDSIEDETPSAIAVAKKYSKGKPLTRENRLKCYKYLLSKGFSYDTAKTAVDGIYDEDDYL